jgi:hypothetical protein
VGCKSYLNPPPRYETPTTMIMSDLDSNEDPIQRKVSNDYTKYRRLDSSKQQIRLVLCTPKKDSNDEILCHLFTTHLHNAPKFNALSYCWGSLAITKTISLIFHDEVIGSTWDIKKQVKATKKGVRGIKNGQYRYIDEFDITSNLFDFIETHRSDRNLFWIDALSINQGDVVERSQQVIFMPNIYSQAQETVVWLNGVQSSNLSDQDYLDLAMFDQALDARKPGFRISENKLSHLYSEFLPESSNYDAREAFWGPLGVWGLLYEDGTLDDFIEQQFLLWIYQPHGEFLQKTSDSQLPYVIKRVKTYINEKGSIIREILHFWAFKKVQGGISSRMWEIGKECRDLCASPYFTRLWVLQEIALSKNIVIRSPGYSVSWKVLVWLQFLWAHLYSQLSTIEEETDKSLYYILNKQVDFPDIWELITYKSVRTTHVRELLESVQDQNATDPRDRVIALLNLNNDLERLNFPVDYTKSVAEVYAEFTRLLIKQSQNLWPMLFLEKQEDFSRTDSNSTASSSSTDRSSASSSDESDSDSSSTSSSSSTERSSAISLNEQNSESSSTSSSSADSSSTTSSGAGSSSIASSSTESSSSNASSSADSDPDYFLPSWVPNFTESRMIPRYVNLSEYECIECTESTRCVHQFRPQSVWRLSIPEHLKLEGLILGKVAYVSRFRVRGIREVMHKNEPLLGSIDDSNDNTHPALVTQWKDLQSAYDNIINPVKTYCTDMDEPNKRLSFQSYVQTSLQLAWGIPSQADTASWICEWNRELGIAPDEVKIDWADIETLRRMKETGIKAAGLEPEEEERFERFSLFNGITALLSLALRWKSFFLDEQGHIGVGSRTVEPGDMIVWLYGSTVPAIIRPKVFTEGRPLRETLQNDQLYEFIEICYLDGVMEGKIFKHPHFHDPLHEDPLWHDDILGKEQHNNYSRGVYRTKVFTLA